MQDRAEENRLNSLNHIPWKSVVDYARQDRRKQLKILKAKILERVVDYAR
jgi:hypothetical protein